MKEELSKCMGRVTALGILARLAYRRALSVDVVTALQMAAKAVAKRHFEHERNKKRRRERREEGGTAAALPNGDGAEAAPVDGDGAREGQEAVA